MRINLQWWSILVTAWLVLFATFDTTRIYPASHWMEARSLTISDGKEGIAPKLAFDRTIHQPFTGEWTVTVRREGAGGFSAFCSSTGKVNYSPSAVVPPNADLDWWTWPTKCRLPVGRYYVATTWQIEVSPDTTKIVSVKSNTFEIRP